MIYKRQKHTLMSRQICTIPNEGNRLYISWRQHISKDGKPIGTGYFLQTPYICNRDGRKQQMLKRILTAGKGAG